MNVVLAVVALSSRGSGQGVAKAPEPMAPVRYAQLPWADFEGRRWGLETTTALVRDARSKHHTSETRPCAFWVLAESVPS